MGAVLKGAKIPRGMCVCVFFLFLSSFCLWKRKWTFDAGSPDERDKWVALIKDAIHDTRVVVEDKEEDKTSKEDVSAARLDLEAPASVSCGCEMVLERAVASGDIVRYPRDAYGSQ